MMNEEEKNKIEPEKASDKPKEQDSSARKNNPKKDWELAPRTGQRHANPFDRKSR